MEDGKRRAYICQQATEQAKKKKEEGMTPTRVTSSLKPFVKKRKMDKVDHQAKKSKVVLFLVRDSLVVTKLPILLCHGVGKGFMFAKGRVTKQRPPPPQRISIHFRPALVYHQGG